MSVSPGIGADRGSLLAIAAGLLLLLISLMGLSLVPQGPFEFAYFPFTPDPLPFAPMRGFTAEQLAEHLLRVLLATPALLLLGWGLTRLRGVALPRLDRAAHQNLALVVSLASLAYMGWLLLFIYQGRAITDDELTYSMQAMVLAEGRLARPEPHLHFTELFTILTRAGFTGKYLLGEPLLQLPGVLLGLPGLMHLPLTALTLWLCYRTMRLCADTIVACWTVILLAASPMLLYTTPTGQSQASALFCITLAGYGYALVKYRCAFWGVTLLGMGVGFGMTVRPQTAAPVGTVLVLAALWELARRRRVAPGLLLLALLALWAASILLYNQALTGSPLTLPWYLVEPIERFGFGQVWKTSTYEHSAWAALQNLGVVAVRFNAWWLGWPSSLLLLWLWLRNGRPTAGAWVWIWAALAVILFESFYYSSGISDTGVAYHFELILPAAVLGANTIRQGLASAPRAWTMLLVVQFCVGGVAFIWYHNGRVGRLVQTIHHDSDAALARITSRPAMLLYDVHPSESMKVGWVFNAFPRRWRSSYDDVVTYPRPPGHRLQAYLDHHQDRSCWYYRRHPRSGEAQLFRCEQAWQLLRRPFVMRKGDHFLALTSTAQRLGWYDPWKARRERLTKEISMEFKSPPRPVEGNKP